ncbi:MAG: GNAT family N-acetyltransferase [Pseudomonadota bacterium]
MPARFTPIDYDREIALAALDKGSGNERMPGAAWIMGDPDGKHGEFAVVVGDPWPGKGIGSNLLEKCLEITEKRGFQRVRGFVLRENQGMPTLGKKLGLRMKIRPDAEEFELTIPLSKGQEGAAHARQ